MDRAEWAACADPGWMLRELGGRASRRKARLFACACARRVGHLLADPRSRDAVAVAERFADGEATEAELNVAADAAYAAADATGDVVRRLAAEAAARAAENEREHWQVRDAWEKATLALEGEAVERAAAGMPNTSPGAALAMWCKMWRGSGRVQGWTERDLNAEFAALLRCLVGDPFRPPAGDPAWRTAAVTGLAAAIYAERAFDRLPILADALEEAGCGEADVLAHCRDAGPHARGCFVLDLILGREGGR